MNLNTKNLSKSYGRGGSSWSPPNGHMARGYLSHYKTINVVKLDLHWTVNQLTVLFRLVPVSWRLC